MKKEQAIAYLERKGKIRNQEEEKAKQERELGLTEAEKSFYTEEEKEEIKTVMKEGRIYGDPMVILKHE